MHSTIAEIAASATQTHVRQSAPRLMAYIRLLRPANLVTSATDVLAGYVVAGAPSGGLAWRLAASLCLYAGGIVLNDFFDRNLDAVERPERPIPSGIVPAAAAGVLGFSLLLAGVAFAFLASLVTGAIACVLACCILAYDSGMKHSTLGPVVMGSCRALNLLLGLAAAPALLPHIGFLAFLPLAYISGITLLSRGEVHGGSRTAAATTLALFAGVILAVAAIYATHPASLLAVSPFLLLLILRAGVPLWKAYAQPNASHIRAAVHAGIISLIVLDSALAAGTAGIICGAAILSLSVLAGELAKLFPVT